MKMKSCIGLVIFLALTSMFFSGCGFDVLETGGTTSPAVTSLTDDSSESTPTPKPTETATPIPEPTEEQKVGTKSNPASIGQEVTLGMEGGYGIKEIEIVCTLSSVVRGEEAESIVMEENQFNEIPEGKEVLLIDTTVELPVYEPEDENESYWVSDWDFTFFDESMAEIERVSVVVPNGLAAELYEGGKTSGNIYTVVPEDTSVTVRWEDVGWFVID